MRPATGRSATCGSARPRPSQVGGSAADDRDMPSQARPLLAIVPVSVVTEAQLDPLARCLVSLYGSAPAGLPIVIAAGADSDPGLLAQVAAAVEELDGELVRSPGAVTPAVNAGLAGARDAGADALVIAQDVE